MLYRDHVRLLIPDLWYFVTFSRSVNSHMVSHAYRIWDFSRIFLLVAHDVNINQGLCGILHLSNLKFKCKHTCILLSIKSNTSKLVGQQILSTLVTALTAYNM